MISATGTSVGSSVGGSGVTGVLVGEGMIYETGTSVGSLVGGSGVTGALVGV
jgi:hypothetical protein